MTDKKTASEPKQTKTRPAAARAAAAQALQLVLQHGRSLTQALPQASEKLVASERAFAQAIAFQVLRQLPVYEWLLSRLLDKPLKTKVRIVHYVLLVGLCQLRDMRVPAHAAIAESVSAASLLKQPALKGMVNAVLRRYQREHDALEAQLALEQDKSATLAFAHPGWLVKRLQQAYPEQWQAICNANNQAPPLWLRVNTQQFSRDDYINLLNNAGFDAVADTHCPSAILLQRSTDVTSLPHFAEGAVSVQDRSAQFAAHILAPQNGERILDACAAPGGKTAHILERAPHARVVALDFDESRLQRVHENLQRLRLNAEVICGDASQSDWWDGELFDAILLDAPCSATGVIRRHPDIKWLRRNEDISVLTELQQSILHQQWQLLKPGGRLLYATCSILPDENMLQIQAFLATVDDAVGNPISSDLSGVDVTQSASDGWQLLPAVSSEHQQGGDGFYYFLLEKKSDA